MQVILHCTVIDVSGVAEASAQDQAEATRAEAREIVAEMNEIAAECLATGYSGDGRWHKPQQESSWKRMAALYAVYLLLICGTAWDITHW